MSKSKADVRIEINNAYPKAKFKTRKEVYTNLRHLRDVGNKYGINKKKFFKAAREKRNKENWEEAKKAYQEFMEETFPLDIDTISEYSTICMHYVEYVDDEKEKEEILELGVRLREWASILEDDNISHKIKLGQHYRVHKKNNQATEIYKELIEKESNDNKKFEYRVNLQTVYIDESSNPQADKIKNLKALKENFNEIKKLGEQLENKRGIIIQLEDSLKRIENRDVIGSNEYKSLFRNPKDSPADSSLKEAKWGVLLYLRIVDKPATVADIKQRWLVNSITTNQILDRLVNEKHIRRIEFTTVSGYEITEDGEKEIEEQFTKMNKIIKDEINEIKSWIETEIIKDDHKDHVFYGFSKRLWKKFYAWNHTKKESCGDNGENCILCLNK